MKIIGNEKNTPHLFLLFAMAAVLFVMPLAHAQTNNVDVTGSMNGIQNEETQVQMPEQNIIRQIPEQSQQQTPATDQTTTSPPLLNQTPTSIPAGTDQTAGDATVQLPAGDDSAAAGTGETIADETEQGQEEMPTNGLWGSITQQVGNGQTPEQAPQGDTAEVPEQPAQADTEDQDAQEITQSPNILSSENGRENMYIAFLNGGQAIPANSTSAFGQAFLTHDRDTNRLCATMNVVGLSADTTFARLQGPARPGEVGPIVLEITPAESGSTTQCSEDLTDQQVTDLQRGRMYIAVGNTSFPNGEIRGQIIPVFRANGDISRDVQTQDQQQQDQQAPPAQSPIPQVTTGTENTETNNGGTTTNGQTGTGTPTDRASE
jgi:hypothetical protein